MAFDPGDYLGLFLFKPEVDASGVWKGIQLNGTNASSNGPHSKQVGEGTMLKSVFLNLYCFC